MIALSVNLNKIALIRNSRDGNYPDVLAHAETCIAAGAHGITVHPRPDLRHIRPDDVKTLNQLLKKYPSIEFNIEGNPLASSQNKYPGFLELVRQSPPDQCTLVPDADNQLTSDHGFNLHKSGHMLAAIIEQLKKQNIRVSLFMDPDLEQISVAADLGADRIELYTGPFAAQYSLDPNSQETQRIFSQHCKAAEHAHKLGLGINAGHDLNLTNLTMYHKLPYLREVSIGHAIIVDAINMGLGNTVRAYLAALSGNTQ